MNAKWSQLSQKQKQGLLRSMNEENLKSLFELTDNELSIAKLFLTEADKADINVENENGKDDAYEEFLKTEYNNIASAHFNTGTSITRFFQFYLLIVSLPITLFGILVRVRQDHVDLIKLVNSESGPFLSVFFGAIALVGLCMMWYVTNLRLDALQYARAVNGVRKYFTDRSGLSVDQELWVRILPRATHQPRYQEFRFFGGVIVSFALFNTLYFIAADALFQFRGFGWFIPGVGYWLL